MKRRIIIYIAAVLLLTGAQTAARHPSRGEIAALDSISASEQTLEELHRIITQLRTISFSNYGDEPLLPSEHDEEPSAEPADEIKKYDPGEAELPDVSVVPHVDPNQAVDILSAAEAFYRAGRFAQAAECYLAYLNRTDSQESDPEDIAWTLFQLGNCFAADKPDEALVYYRKLITEHPTSLWTPIALTREQILSWQEYSQVRQLLEKKVDTTR